MSEQVLHFAASKDGVSGEVVCGAPWPWELAVRRSEVTCPDCLADLAEVEAPAIACSSMHEHDEVACAAPSSAEMTLDVVGARLAELHARIEAVFENDGDRQSALSEVRDEIGDLLALLATATLGAVSE